MNDEYLRALNGHGYTGGDINAHNNGVRMRETYQSLLPSATTATTSTSSTPAYKGSFHSSAGRSNQEKKIQTPPIEPKKPYIRTKKDKYEELRAYSYVGLAFSSAMLLTQGGMILKDLIQDGMIYSRSVGPQMRVIAALFITMGAVSLCSKVYASRKLKKLKNVANSVTTPTKPSP